eukprot:gene11308-7840_t
MTDQQVSAASKIKPRASLLDKLLDSYDVYEKEPAFPFKTRLILCGKVVKKLSLSDLEKLYTEGGMKADLTNPFTAATEKSAECSSIIIDYTDHFLQIIEGDERHIYFYISELWCHQEKGQLADVKILFIDDDITGKPFQWMVLNKLPPAALGGGEVPEKSDDEIGDCVARDISNLIELGRIAAGIKKSNFMDNAKIDHGKLFPKSELVQLYMKSNLFLTLSEFKEWFCKFPDLVREVERYVEFKQRSLLNIHTQKQTNKNTNNIGTTDKKQK